MNCGNLIVYQHAVDHECETEIAIEQRCMYQREIINPLFQILQDIKKHDGCMGYNIFTVSIAWCRGSRIEEEWALVEKHSQTHDWTLGTSNLELP